MPSAWPARNSPGIRNFVCSRVPAGPSGPAAARSVSSRSRRRREDCLVRTRLTRWYEGSRCELCGREIGEIHWGDHRPALMSPDRRTLEWDEVRPEALAEVWRRTTACAGIVTWRSRSGRDIRISSSTIRSIGRSAARTFVDRRGARRRGARAHAPWRSSATRCCRLVDDDAFDVSGRGGAWDLLPRIRGAGPTPNSTGVSGALSAAARTSTASRWRSSPTSGSSPSRSDAAWLSPATLRAFRGGACRGWDEFSNADLERHCSDVLGRNVVVV